MSALFGGVGTSVVRPHDPGLLRVQLEDLEVRVALLQAHALAISAKKQNTFSMLLLLMLL